MKRIGYVHYQRLRQLIHRREIGRADGKARTCCTKGVRDTTCTYLSPLDESIILAGSHNSPLGCREPV